MSSTFGAVRKDWRTTVASATIRDVARDVEEYAATRPRDCRHQQVADDGHGCRSVPIDRRHCIEGDPPMATSPAAIREACGGRHEVQSNRRIASVLRSGSEHRTHAKIADGLDARGRSCSTVWVEKPTIASCQDRRACAGARSLLPRARRCRGKPRQRRHGRDDDGCSAARGRPGRRHHRVATGPDARFGSNLEKAARRIEIGLRKIGRRPPGTRCDLTSTTRA